MTINITNLDRQDLQVMLAAAKLQHEHNAVLKDTLGYDIHHQNHSILEELAGLIFDKVAKTYKQKTFSIKLWPHQARVLTTGLSKYKNQTTITPFDKNRAVVLELALDPKTK